MTNVSEPIVIRYWIRHYAAKFEAADFVDPEREDYPGTIQDYGNAFIKRNIGAVTGEMQKALKELGYKGDDLNANRRLILCFLFGDESQPIGPLSSNQLMAGQVYGLKRWISAKKIDGQWMPRRGFVEELAWVRSTSEMIQTRGKLYIPEMSLGQVIADVFPDIENRAMKQPFDIEHDGMVAAGLCLGGALTKVMDAPFSWGESVMPVKVRRPPVQRAEPPAQPVKVAPAFVASLEPIKFDPAELD